MTEPKQFLPFWYNDFDPLAWDTIFLGGELFPGIANVTGPGLKRKVDVKKPKGSDGASLRDEGIEPARLEIELLIYNISDWEDLQGKLPIITPRKKGGLRTPLSIVHPLTRLLGINNIYIDSIPFPELDKSTGFLSVRFTAIEWYPAPKPVKTGKAAGTSGSNKEDHISDEDAMKMVQQQIDATLAGLFDEQLGGDPTSVAESGMSNTANTQAENAINNAFPP